MIFNVSCFLDLLLCFNVLSRFINFSLVFSVTLFVFYYYAASVFLRIKLFITQITF